jgi:hypothetical protein
MSKASEWVAHQTARPRATFQALRVEVTNEGDMALTLVGGMSNSTVTIQAIPALQLAQWIIATFADKAETRP